MFHHMWGGELHLESFGHARDGAERYNQTKHEHSNDGVETLPFDAWKTLKYTDDQRDWMLFKHAKAIFQRNMKKYGLEDPSLLDQD